MSWGTSGTALLAGREKRLSCSAPCLCGLTSSTVCILVCHSIKGHKTIRECYTLQENNKEGEESRGEDI